MNDNSFVRQEIIDASELDPLALACPKCQGRTLVLHGNAQVAQREIMEEGLITDRRTFSEDGGFFDVERIDCLPCSTTFHVRDPKLFQLEREVLDLKNKLALVEWEQSGGSNGGSGRIGLPN